MNETAKLKLLKTASLKGFEYDRTFEILRKSSKQVQYRGVFHGRSQQTNRALHRQNLDCCENLSVLSDRNTLRTKFCQARQALNIKTCLWVPRQDVRQIFSLFALA